MDEEQNQAKEALKNVAKQEANKLKRSILKKIWPVLIKIIAVLIVVLLIFGVVYAAIEAILSVVRGISGQNGNTYSSLGEEINSLVSLSDDGYNYILNEDKLNEIIEKLQKGALNTSAAGLTYSEKNSRDEDGNLKETMIKKYVKAEIISMFPKIGSNDIDGIINIYRDNGDANSSARELSYIPYSNFIGYTESNSEAALNYYSLNPESFELCYATSSITETNSGQGSRQVQITKYETNYQNALQGYIMPLSFLLSTHFLAQNEDFMNELLEMQTKDSFIDLTLKDTVSTNVITVDYSGDIKTKTEEYAEYTTNSSSNSSSSSESNSNSKAPAGASTRSITVSRQVEGDNPSTTTKSTTNNGNSNTSGTTSKGSVTLHPIYSTEEGAIDNSNVGNYYSETRDHQTTVTNTSTQLVVTKAKTWIATKENTYTKKVESTTQDPQTNNIDIPEQSGETENFIEVENNIYEPPTQEQITNNIKKAIENKGVTNYTVTKEKIVKSERYIIKETINETNTYTTYTETKNETSLDNVEKIVELFNKKEYAKVKNNVTTAPKFYFELLSRDERTQNIEQIMRYVMYKLTGKSYGVTDLQNIAASFDVGTFSDTTFGGAAEEVFLEYLHAIEGGKTNAAGTHYIIESDGSKTGLAVGHGIDIKAHKSKLNSLGYTNLSAGQEIPVEVIDKIEKDELEENLKAIKTKTSNLNLTEYQTYALLARVYNCGLTGGLTKYYPGQEGSFTEVYSKYWNQERDDKYGTTTQGDYNHGLYTKFMHVPVTSQGQVLKGLEYRRKLEWNMFQTGWVEFYGKVSKFMPKGSSGTFPRYYQGGQSWSGIDYQGGTIGKRGCGACCLAMAVTGLTGMDETPDKIVNFLNSKGVNTVTNGEKCSQLIAQKYGLNYEKISRTDQANIDRVLNEGKVCIFSINSNGIYRGGGHFIMCYKKDNKGYYVLESGHFYNQNIPYNFNQVFTSGVQGVFVLGR